MGPDQGGKRHSAFTMWKALKRRKFYLLAPMVLVTAAVRTKLASPGTPAPSVGDTIETAGPGSAVAASEIPYLVPR